MSFSATVKNEMCRIEMQKECCQLFELKGIMTAGVDLSARANSFKLVTESAAVSRKIYILCKSLFNLTPTIEIKKLKKLKKHVIYVVGFDQFFASKEISSKLLFDEAYKKCCKRAFLRGVFMSSGSIIEPDRTYHLELSIHQEQNAINVNNLIQEFGLHSRIISRKGKNVIYLKEGQEIVDFLNITGAHKALLKLENVRIIKEMRNNVNRIVNCETANLEKTVNTAVRQVEKIQYIKETVGFEFLPESLRQIAELRSVHTEVSLKELGQMLSPPLGKSGTNHRLRKIEAIYDELKGKKKL